MINRRTFAAWAVLCSCAWAQQTDPSTQATEILNLARVSGGLIVHVGCGDGKVTADLRASEAYLVHGLDASVENVAAARKHVAKEGRYGPVTIDRLSGKALPHADNLVNLVVVESDQTVGPQEVLRVLRPGGVVLTRSGGKWTRAVKPWPASMGQWTHYLYDATNNAVSCDTQVGPPTSLQWKAKPLYSRNHEYKSSVNAAVAAGGRIFYVIDEGPAVSMLLPGKWSLVARDAFNGVLLWKMPLPNWHGHIWTAKGGPMHVTRKLVAVGDRVYFVPGEGQPAVMLDATTGRVLRTWPETKNTEEIIVTGKLLLAVVGPAELQLTAPEGDKPVRQKERTYDYTQGRKLVAIDTASGEIRWRHKAKTILTMTLAARDGRAFLHDGDGVVAVSLADGKEQWRSPSLPIPRKMHVYFAPTLVVTEQAVLLAWNAKFTALAPKTGRVLWSGKAPYAGYSAPADVLIAGGLVWTGNIAIAWRPNVKFVGRDVTTGEVRKEISALTGKQSGMPHHRCHRMKATNKYILSSQAGIEFVDLQAGRIQPHHWVRGACLYGILAANGLVYAPPHPCGCFIESKLVGFNALSSAPLPTKPYTPVLEKGSAYGAIRNLQSAIHNAAQWPTYRCDNSRSGRTTATVPAKPKIRWQADLGETPSSPTIADGKIFVALPGSHRVCAIDAATGKVLWRFTAGGRVDSPPTIAGGRAIFGCADGWVYCLGASDGQLVWRSRAAPAARRIIVFGRLESPWPVHGSVLVRDGVVYAAAGRSSHVDGGIFLRRIDADTGKTLSTTRVYDRDEKSGAQGTVKGFALAGAMNDILSCSGDTVFMRHRPFDLAGRQARQRKDHLFSSAGFLDDTWWHRTYWQYGTQMSSGFRGWRKAWSRVPAGRIMAIDDKLIYGYGRVSPLPVGKQLAKGDAYHLFAASKTARKPLPKGGRDLGDGQFRTKGPDGKGKVVMASQTVYRWRYRCPIRVRAMVLAGGSLALSGPVGDGTESLDEHEGKKGSRLMVLSAADASVLGQCDLPAPPVFDGMAATNGNLFVTLIDGKIICLGKAQR